MPELRYETDLYKPVKEYFEALGYMVQGEVKGIDAVAVKEDEMILLELKKAFNLKLLYQALDRQKISPLVYLVIPRPKKANGPDFRNAVYITKKLELGLITVAVESPFHPVDIHVEPAGVRKINKRRRGSVAQEIEGRELEGSCGGSVKAKMLTAYRERSIRIACILYNHAEPLSAAKLVKEYGCEPDAHNILYSNHYDWFRRCGRGLYELSSKGREEIEHGEQFRNAFDFYMGKGRGEFS